MNSAAEFEFAEGRARVVPLRELRASEHWTNAFAHLCKNHRYYEIIDGTLTFECCVLVLEDRGGEVIGLQPFFFVDQDLVTTAPRWMRVAVNAGRRAWPRIFKLRMLMAGCAAGEGHLPADGYFKNSVGEMGRILKSIARARGASLVVWKDFPTRYRAAMAPLIGADTYARISSMPGTRLPLDFTSFEEYMERRLSHATRKNLRRKFRALEGKPPVTMTVASSISDVAEEVHALYLQVFDRAPLQFERLSTEFLIELGNRMAERVRFFLWRQEDRLVAFSLCMVHDGALYDEYLGLDYRVALDLHLYFVTFRDLVCWALAEGLRSYHSTPLNYAPKLHLGFELSHLDLYAAHTSPLWNFFLRKLLPWLGPTRGEPLLKRFPNAAQLDGE